MRVRIVLAISLIACLSSVLIPLALSLASSPVAFAAECQCDYCRGLRPGR